MLQGRFVRRLRSWVVIERRRRCDKMTMQSQSLKLRQLLYAYSQVEIIAFPARIELLHRCAKSEKSRGRASVPSSLHLIDIVQDLCYQWFRSVN